MVKQVKSQSKIDFINFYFIIYKDIFVLIRTLFFYDTVKDNKALPSLPLIIPLALNNSHPLRPHIATSCDYPQQLPCNRLAQKVKIYCLKMKNHPAFVCKNTSL